MTYPLAAETYIPKRWLPFLRALWILMAVSLFVLYAWGLGANYGELVKLYRKSRPRRNQIRLARRYRVRELPSLFRAYGAFMKRLKNLAEDYAIGDGPR